MITKLLKAVIRLHQAAAAYRAPACRFTPSCSSYALEALDRFGARRAVPLIVARLARCRPGGPFGLDPVPETLGKAADGAAPVPPGDAPRAVARRGPS